MPKRPLTFLEQVLADMTPEERAEHAAAVAEGLWFKNDLKVVESALRRAKENKDAWRRLRTLLVQWAKKDEEMRRELLAELQALGKRGAAPKPWWRALLLAEAVDVWRTAGTVKTVDEGLHKAAALHHDLLPRDLRELRRLRKEGQKLAAEISARDGAGDKAD